MRKKTKQVTLVLTESCNLNCVYCYENNKSNKKMTWETARLILDKELNDAEEYEYVTIDLFGGEPFLNFELMKAIVEYIDFKAITNIRYKSTTNGTLVHGAIQEWLIHNAKKISLSLSLDGKKETHNFNRPNSFDKIDISFFLKFFKNVPIKMTVSPQRINNLYDDVIYCQDIGFKVNCNLAVAQDWSGKDKEKALETQLGKLIEFYLKHTEIEPCSLINEKIVQIGLELSRNTTKWCGVGTHMHTYDVNGNMYPCHFFLPNSIGLNSSKSVQNFTFTEKFDSTLLEKKCQTCSVREGCPTCYGSNYIMTGNLYKKDETYCKQIKTILKARAYFRAKQWEKGMLSFTNPTDEQLLLKAILKIQNI